MTTFQCQSCESTSAGRAVTRAGPKSLLCTYCADSLAARAHGFCRKCRQPRPLPFGTAHHGAWCVACDKAYMHAKYMKAKDARLAYQRVYQQQHWAREMERHQAYRAAHRAEINARRRKHVAAHPERRREQDRRYRLRHPEYHRQRSAAWRAANPGYAQLARARRKLNILWGRA